jgi:L-threonylcarbamoyladenylate synthase
LIRRGGLVAFPTETVYGLGADAGNATAVARVFEVKRRPTLDPLIVHVASRAQAEELGRFPHPVASVLAERFWPGPLTLVVPRTPAVPEIVTAGLETVAVRMPAHPVALSLIREACCAIAAPSANPFGYVSPTEAAHVSNLLGNEVDLILDGGRCTVGIESTVLSLVDSPPRVLRAGGTPMEDLRLVLGPVELNTSSSSQPRSPGQLTKHYATRTPFVLATGESAAAAADGRIGLISLTRPERPDRFAAVEVLSPAGNLREAAAGLFSALRRLDSAGLDLLVGLPFPEHGLGVAIMDRLRRCAAGSGDRMLH